ncbi:hypothetical protein KC19_4G132100 [Ceratodon purpureus]|uniref:Uncharacterized protein n=1 Tax=Ceratodon purpureus TaxID=3225 RepID=A0A8T0I8V4_CERPU|nr:hypothetical protein KC19_4G132100 [Ceratodon purpureus]
MEQCKRILNLSQGDSIWSHLGNSRRCSDRQADANVAPPVAAVPPRSPKSSKHVSRWRRYNPMSKLRWRKNKKAPKIPGHGQKVKAAVRPALPGTKLNVVNPLYYIRRIKNKLAKSGRQRTPT